jgi:hypothetical protein
MGRTRGFTLGLVLVMLVAAGTALARHSTTITLRPGFTARVTNPWYPLKSRSRYVYRGVKDGESSREVMIVTGRTKVIDGAPCAAIDDRLYLRGRLEERTTDWYSQDAKGNVWYFGEATAELDRNGKVTSTEGSWMAGVHGAKPGIFMFAHPRPGQQARQEYYKGHAEDHFRVVRMRTSITVPYISSTRAMLTREWTPLEPGVIDHKYYVRGIGTVLEQTVKGPVERNELVSFRRGP